MTGLVELNPGFVIAFYGMDKVRFVQPTKIGDTIHVESEVIEVEDKNQNSGVVSFSVEVKNQNDATVASSVMRMLVAKGE